MKNHLKIDQAVYRVTVRWKDRIKRITVVCCLNSFDEAAELACQAAAVDLDENVDEFYAVSIGMLTDSLIIEQEWEANDDYPTH